MLEPAPVGAPAPFLSEMTSLKELNITAKFKVALTHEASNPGSATGAVTRHIALEFPESLDQDAPTLLDLEQALSICRQAMSDELAAFSPVHHDRSPASPSATRGPRRANRKQFTSGLVSGKQLADIRQLAAQVTGLGAEKLEQLCQRLFHRRAEALSSLEASNLIETLKQANAKEPAIEALLDELN